MHGGLESAAHQHEIAAVQAHGESARHRRYVARKLCRAVLLGPARGRASDLSGPPVPVVAVTLLPVSGLLGNLVGIGSFSLTALPRWRNHVARLTPAAFHGSLIDNGLGRAERHIARIHLRLAF
jgi:hypothetical protein